MSDQNIKNHGGKNGAYIQVLHPPCVTSFKIQQSCFLRKATHVVHNSTLLLSQDIASPSSQIYIQSFANCPYEKHFPPEKIKRRTVSVTIQVTYSYLYHKLFQLMLCHNDNVESAFVAIWGKINEYHCGIAYCYLMNK